MRLGYDMSLSCEFGACGGGPSAFGPPGNGQTPWYNRLDTRIDTWVSTWYPAWNAAFMNWTNKHWGTVSLLNCIAVPGGVNEIHDLQHGIIFPAPSPSTDGGGGKSIWVININGHRNGGQNPLGSAAADGKFNAAAAAIDYSVAEETCRHY